MSKQKQPEINEQYRGKIHAAIAKSSNRLVLIAKHNEREYNEVLALHQDTGFKVLQTYRANQLGIDILYFAVTHMNRGTNFGDLSKLLF